LPAEHYYKCVEETKKVIANSSLLSETEKASIMTVGYGHVGDGNLHLNVSLHGYDNEDLQNRLYQVVDQFVMDYTAKVRGSVSAEHGVGL
jgi:FAD/FMN-containing dehydrogenase